MTANKNISILDYRGQFSYNPETFFGNELIQRTGELLEEMEQPLFSRYDTGITHRELNWWVREAVISANVLETKKFTLVELVWIKVAERLRDLSISLSLIKAFKEHLLSPIKIKGLMTKAEKAQSIFKTIKLNKEQKNQLLALFGQDKKEKEHSITIMHLLVTDYFFKRKPVSFGIFSDGTYLIIDKRKEHFYSEADKKRLSYGNYINISLSEILKDFLLSTLTEILLRKIHLPFIAEHNALKTINSGDYKSITLYFQNKKISPLELKAGAQTKEKLIDTLFYSEENAINEVIVKDKKGGITKYSNIPTIVL